MSQSKVGYHETKYHKKDLVPDNFLRKVHVVQLVKKAFAIWGDDSIESERDIVDHEDVSMMTIEDDKSVFNSIFSLMEKSDDEEDSNEANIFELKDDVDNLLVENLRKLAAF